MVQAENERARTVRYGGQLSVLALDLDYFKTVNDSFGHQAGCLLYTSFNLPKKNNDAPTRDRQ